MLKIFEYGKMWFEKAMTEDDVNSRLQFFLHGVVSSGCVLGLTIAFIVHPKDGYDYMVMAVGGSGAAAAVGRYMTKKGGPAPAVPNPNPTRDDG